MAIDTVQPTRNPRQCKCGHNFNRHYGQQTEGDAAELCRDCDCAGYESLSECMRVQAHKYVYSLQPQTEEYDALCDLLNARGIVDRSWIRDRLIHILADFGSRISREQKDAGHTPEQEANEIDPRGCTCPNNGAGDCPWCEAKSIAESQ